MRSFIEEHLKSTTPLIVIAIIVFIFYFLDKDLSRVLGIAGLFVWFLREYSRQLLQKDLEKFKAQLKKESIEFKIVYKEMHMKRAEAIEQIHKIMLNTKSGLEFCLKNIGSLSWKRINERCENNISLLKDYYEKNKLFFEENLVEDIDVLMEKLSKVWTHLMLAKGDPLGENPPMDYRQLKKAMEELNQEIPEVIELLREKFRKIIGISSEN